MKREVRWHGEVVGILDVQGAEMFEIWGRFLPKETPIGKKFLASITVREGPMIVVELVNPAGGEPKRFYFGMYEEGELTLKMLLSKRCKVLDYWRKLFS